TAVDADPTIDSINVSGGGVNLNAGQDPVFGDSIAQDFTTAVGQELAVVVELSSFQGNARHDFLVEIFDDAGNLIDSITARTDAGNGSDFISLTFTAISATSSIKITNTGATTTINSDARIDNVGVFDLATTDEIQQIGRGGNSNRFQGTDADDLLIGGGRQDIFQGSEGADTIDGGNGADTLDYSASTEGVNVFGRGSGNEVASTGGLAEGDVIRNIDRVIGSEFDDVIDVRTNKVTLEGRGGDDLILGDTNFDRLDGGDGDDTIFGDSQNDTLIGGAGNDALDGGNGVADVAEFTGNLSNFSFAGAGDELAVLDLTTGDLDVLRNIEILRFDDGDVDVTTVQAGAAEFFNFVGDETDETIDGTLFNDQIAGQSGNDALNGLGGDDMIFGSRGNDTIDGGAG
ncbi:MAG: hypothetical protein AAFU50_10635, partial [Pseudomonadota bacterium]